MIIELNGADAAVVPAKTGSGFDINNFINAISNSVNKIWGQEDTTAEEKSAQLETIFRSAQAQVEANQKLILTVGGLGLAALVAFSVFRKK